MIQFNLLPDVKLEYVKAQRTKHLVMVVSVIVAGVMIALMVILFAGTQVQKRHLANLDADIKAKSSQLQNEPDLSKILTVQNQLNTLNGLDENVVDGLHEGKPAVERIGEYLSNITPDEVSISDVKVDLSLKTISFTGSSKSIKAVNEFVDTMKFATFTKQGQETKAFSPVVLKSFGRSGEDKATYQIEATFDPGIFDTTQQVTLRVPNEISTRSVKERPDPLFQQTSGEGQ